MKITKDIDNFSKVSRVEVRDNKLNIEIEKSETTKDFDFEITILNNEKIFNKYKGREIDKFKYLFEIDLIKFNCEDTEEFEVIVTENKRKLELQLEEKITIEKIIIQDNIFINKAIIKSGNGKIILRVKKKLQLKPEIESVDFTDDLHIKGEFKNDIKILNCNNIKMNLRLFNSDSGEELIRDINVNNLSFDFKISQEDIFKMNSINNKKWSIYINVLDNDEVITSNYLLFEDYKAREIIRKELNYNNYNLDTSVYLTKKLRRISLKFYNDVKVDKIIKITLKGNKTLIRVRTKKDITDIFNKLKLSILVNNKEYIPSKVKLNGKKTFTLEIQKEVLNSILENGVIIKEVIEEKVFLEKINEVNKDIVISSLKERVSKSKRYNKLLKDIYSTFLLKLPIKKNKVLFESFLGRNYSGNPKYIYENMIDKGLDKKYNLIWFFNDTSEEIKGSGKKIKRKSLAYYYHIATAKYWIFNTRQVAFIKKRDENIYLQTWHGTPLKKLAMDMDSVDMGGLKDIDKYKDMFYKNSRRWDLLLSQNDYSKEIFKRAFAFDKEILNYGYPANDILYTKNNIEDIDKIKDKLNIPKDKKVILYAPTWRDNNFIKKGHYKMEMKLELEKMQKELGNEYIVLLRMHYLIMNSLEIENFEGFAYNFSEGFDIQELYLVSDILITDYSSVMFDYSNLKRDILFFAYDIEEYRDTLRGFYFDFENEAPGPILKTTDEIIENILNLNGIREDYKAKREGFYKKYCSIDDGNASERVVNRLFKL